MKQGGGWYYYLADGLGSTMVVVDASGDVVRDYQYDVYGAPTGGSGSLANELDFAGQQTDGSTGLQYLRARYYDPATGVLLSGEPLARLTSWIGHNHAYASGNPPRYRDPGGNYPVDSSGCRVDQRMDPYCAGDDAGGHKAVPGVEGCSPGGALWPACDYHFPPYPCSDHQRVPSGKCGPAERTTSDVWRFEIREYVNRYAEYMKDQYNCKKRPRFCAEKLVELMTLHPRLGQFHDSFSDQVLREEVKRALEESKKPKASW
jgi:RHS repeat-associated protein